MKVTAPPAPAARSLHEICAAARQATCGECWQVPGEPCTQVPEGDHVARFGRAMRRGLISGPELIAVLDRFAAFTTATVVETPGGPESHMPCRDYDPMFKLYGCELGAGHDGPHRDCRGNEWEEHLPAEPERCDVDWGSGYRSQRCVHAAGHSGQHRDESGNEWGGGR